MSPMAQDLPTCRERLAQVEEENARLRDVLAQVQEIVVELCAPRPTGGQQVSPPPYAMTPYTRKVLARILDTAGTR